MHIDQKEPHEYTEMELHALGFFWREKQDEAIGNLNNIRKELQERARRKSIAKPAGNGETSDKLKLVAAASASDAQPGEQP